WVLDGGPCAVGVESTIVDLSTGKPTLLRPGGVPPAALEAALGERLAKGSGSTRSPGTLPAHYAPRAGVLLADRDSLAAKVEGAPRRGGKVAVLAPANTNLPPGAEHFVVPETVDGLARVLYAELRRADAEGVDTVVVRTPRAEGVGIAILDRLARAAASR